MAKLPFDTTTWAGMREYVSALYGAWLGTGVNTGGVGGLLWSTGMVSVEGSKTEWFGGAGLDWLERAFPDMGADLYMCIGLMRAGSKARGNRNVVAQPLLIVDDVGTKIDAGKWAGLFALGFPRPTATVETSPGNYTLVWSLDGDAGSADRFVDLAVVRAWLVHLKLTDDVMDPARYIRLPGGWNSKAKYKAKNGGQAVGVRLSEWNECRESEGGSRADLGKMGEILAGAAKWAAREFPPGPAGKAGVSSAALGKMLDAGQVLRSADMANPEPIIKLAQVVGLNPVQIRPGVVEALCPNIGAHGDRAESGFAFLGDGLMKCQHASCQGFSTRDFRGMMMDEFDRQAGVAVGLGLGGLDGCADAVAYLARETFVRAGAVAGGGAGLTDEEMAGVAAMAAAASARAARAVADLDGLVARYAFVNTLQAFFDRGTRRLIPANDIDTVEDVLRVIPAGASGSKRARFQLVNHPGMVHLDGVVRASGDVRDVVEQLSPEGDLVRLANTWRGSRYLGLAKGAVSGASLRVRYPKEWLALVELVIPDRAYREWFLDWVAFGFQFPGLRRMTIPVLVGGQGIGKDAIFWVVKQLYGFNNVTTVEMNQLGSNFNDWAQNDLVILTELKFDPQGKMYNTVKGMLANTEDWITINGKFQRTFRAKVNFSLVSTTNHLDALQGLEPDDRRFQPYLSPAVVQPKSFYVQNVAESSQPANLEGALEWLLARDLSGFSPFTAAPGSSAAKQVMAVDNLSGAALWAFQSVEPGAGGRFDGRSFLTLAEVETAALADPSRRVSGSVDAKPLSKGLRAAGWVSFGEKVGPRNDRVRVWLSPLMADLASGWTPKQVHSAYLADRDAASARLLKNI